MDMMLVNKEAYEEIISKTSNKNATLVAVSKTKPVEAIKELYDLGQRDFGENYVQELLDKQPQLPADIRWHFIGHLQSNKVKYIVPFVSLIHGIDSLKLLTEVNKQAQKNGKIINVLLQVHIAQEETKFGFDEQELEELFGNDALKSLNHIRICGFMGMATFIDDKEQIRSEFRYLKSLLEKYRQQAAANCRLETLSMGMSGDYQIALEEGSTMIRIGSLLFGERNHAK